MASDLRTSETGLRLIMAYEGFRSRSNQLPDGRWVIGYGHMKAARAGLRVSQAEAAAILREYDLPPVETALKDLLLVPVSQNEFDALASFVFNIGVDQFESSDVLAHLNAGDKLKAAEAMERWRKARVGNRDMIVDPLVRRRADEKSLFLKTVGTVPLAASSRFRPLPEEDAVAAPGRPAKPREEKVRHAAPANDRVEGETATEAAARNVRERLTRILGQHEAGDAQDEPVLDPIGPAEKPRPPRPQHGEASVEEIRAAISALVADDDEDDRPTAGDIELEEIRLDDAPSRQQDKSDPFDIETGSLRVDSLGKSARSGRVVIDDVSPVKIPPADPTLQHGEITREGPLEIFLFGLAALVGAGLFAYGGSMMFGWFGIDWQASDDMLAYLPPFLMMSGGLLFLIMAYYCARALLSND